MANTKKIKVTIWLPPEIDKGLELAMAKESVSKSGIVEELLRQAFPTEISQARQVIRRQGQENG